MSLVAFPKMLGSELVFASLSALSASKVETGTHERTKWGVESAKTRAKPRDELDISLSLRSREQAGI